MNSISLVQPMQDQTTAYSNLNLENTMNETANWLADCRRILDNIEAKIHGPTPPPAMATIGAPAVTAGLTEMALTNTKDVQEVARRLQVIRDLLGN